jgi:hypothetical protein
MDPSKWNVVSCVTTVVEMNDVFVSVVWLDGDFVEQRLDVCPVPHGVDGSENESGDESVVVVVELLQVEEDDLE